MTFSRKNRDKFPLSRKRAEPNGFEGYVSGRDNPLSVLFPLEAQTAELFVLCQSDPRVAKTMQNQKPKKWSVLTSGLFNTLFLERFGFQLAPADRKGLEANAAWRDYVEHLQTQTRDAVMAKLKQDALSAYEDYKWSRTAAREAGDFKETRLAAADHLDRIGATEKPTEIAPNVVVMLRGRNFDEQTLNKELPETSFEIVATEVTDGEA